MNVKIVFLCFFFLGCGGPTISNPSATLRETGRSHSIHLEAMEMLDGQVGLENVQYRATLHRMLWVAGYTNVARQAALNRLWTVDRKEVIKTIRQRLPRIDNWNWIEQLCDWIATEEILELDVALISSWSQPTLKYEEFTRPERQALVLMYGEEALESLVFQSLISTNKSWQQGYRIRCWELLLRIGARDTLLALLNRFVPKITVFWSA